MAPRLSKRQQRELEELEALKQVPGQDVDEEISEQEEVAVPSQPRPSGFANLITVEDGESSEAEEVKSSKSKKSKKKKKKAAEPGLQPQAPTAEPVKETPKPSRTATPTVPASEKSEKKALKRAKQKEKKSGNDEIDKALAELSIQYPASQKISQSEPGKQSLADLLSVSLSHLDSDAEMRKFFGAKVVQASKASESSGRRKLPTMSTVRSHLTRPQPTWWSAKGREGLSLRLLSDEETDEKLKRHSWSSIHEKWWTVEYSKRYKGMTKVFMDTVLSGDPQGFWDLIGTLPWHADTLLQLSEVYRHREEHAQAVDFIDRALFTYERAFMGAFNFTGGLNRLDFDQVENRPFLLAVHRQIIDLQRRGCSRTSFEFARLLYSVDPWSDPHGSVLHLDFLSVKSGMHQWLLDVYDFFSSRQGSDTGSKDQRLDPTLLPGWAYARALALRLQEEEAKTGDHSKSTAALKSAVQDFPSIVPLLADKLDLALSPSLRAHRDFRIETDASSLSDAAAILHLLSHLYAQRSFPVWKDYAPWFSSTVEEQFSSLPSSLPVADRRKAFLGLFEDKNLRYSIYRHVMVLESSLRRLFSFIPRQVLESRSFSCDPLPPPTSISEYNPQYFQGVESLRDNRASRTRRQREMDQRRLAQLIPNGPFREQIVGLFAANPQFANRFPGGVVQFAQALAQLDPEALDDMLAIEAVNAPGAMPGGLENMQEDGDGGPEFQELHFVDPPAPNPQPRIQRPDDVQIGDDDEENIEDEEDEESDEEILPMPQRVLRNILGRFWGGAAPADDSSSEDERQHADDMGVD